MSRYSHNSVARSDNLKSRGGPADANHAAGGARRRALLLGTALAGTVALVPFAAQAASDTWQGAGSTPATNAWETPGNWTGGLPTTTSGVIINNVNSVTNPVQLNSNVSLNAGTSEA